MLRTLAGFLASLSSQTAGRLPANRRGPGPHGLRLVPGVTTFAGCRAWWNSDDGWDYISQEVQVVVENCWSMGNGCLPFEGKAPDLGAYELGTSTRTRGSAPIRKDGLILRASAGRLELAYPLLAIDRAPVRDVRGAVAVP